MGSRIFVGIDTHKELHAVCALDESGAVVLERACAADEAGYDDLCRALEGAGSVARVAIEGSSSYGRGISDHMRRRGYDVQEALCPGKRAYNPKGKTDAIDALAAARLAFWDQCAGEAKDNGGPSEDLAYLVAARDSAVRECRRTGSALQGLIAKAPSNVRDPLVRLKGRALAQAVMSSDDGESPVIFGALRSLAKRWIAAYEEAKELAALMEGILKTHYAPLLGAKGVGVATAATLVAIAGKNPERFTSEAAFAKSMGVCPIPASSGKSHHMRLNRGGNRTGNKALHQIAVARLRRDAPTQEYIAKKVTEGKSKRDAVRCLKRYIAREVYRLLLKCGSDAELIDVRDLRARRKRLGIRQATVSSMLEVSTPRISLLEREVTIDSALAQNYLSLIEELEQNNAPITH